MPYHHSDAGDRMWRCSPKYDPIGYRQTIVDAVIAGGGRLNSIAAMLGLKHRQARRHIDRLALWPLVDRVRHPARLQLERARAILRGEHHGAGGAGGA